MRLKDAICHVTVLTGVSGFEAQCPSRSVERAGPRECVAFSFHVLKNRFSLSAMVAWP